MPEVIEAARALSWQRRGGLIPLYGNRQLPSVFTEAVDILESARNEVEARTDRERREDMKRGS